MMGDRIEPEPQVGVLDTVDLMDLTALDPEPGEIIDPNDPGWVEPATDCTPAAKQDLTGWDT